MRVRPATPMSTECALKILMDDNAQQCRKREYNEALAMARDALRYFSEMQIQIPGWQNEEQNLQEIGADAP